MIPRHLMTKNGKKLSKVIVYSLAVEKTTRDKRLNNI